MTNDADDYCDGCKHMQYEAATDSCYCGLNKEPKPDPDEPEQLYCDSKEDEMNEGNNYER